MLGQDTAVELGNPKNASKAFLVWVNDPAVIKNGRISLVGPDLANFPDSRCLSAKS
ncbi:MAG: hypothetical protein R2874_02375 [Desulfobacterales bacterium]